MGNLVWQKSSYSSTGNACIEIATDDGGVIRMRESDEPGRTITTTPVKLAAFIAGVKAGEFDHFIG
jgi:hypothetical protein